MNPTRDQIEAMARAAGQPKIYLASRVSKRPVLYEWGDELERAGFEIVSRWSKRGNDHILAPGQKSEQAPRSERIRFAEEDIEDLMKADIVISLAETPRNDSRGGRHVEFGYALALGKEMYVVGEAETVFHELPAVMRFDTWSECFESICLAAVEKGIGMVEGER